MFITDIPTPCKLIPVEESDRLFFATEDKEIAQAKALCANCHMTKECLELGKVSRYGVFGGKTPTERGIAL